MTGSPKTRSAGQVRKSPQQNKVGLKTGKVRKSTIATRRSLNGKSTGKRIATKPAPKVDIASSNSEVGEVEEVDNNRDEQRQKTKVSSNVEADNVLEQPANEEENCVVKGICREKEEEARKSQKTRDSA
jgi:hypothetical protein